MQNTTTATGVQSVTARAFLYGSFCVRGCVVVQLIRTVVVGNHGTKISLGPDLDFVAEYGRLSLQ